MNNKETLQSYNTNLTNNNETLSSILNTINSLPEAGGSENLTEVLTTQDEKITTQETTITDIIAALNGKAAGGGTVSAHDELLYIGCNGATYYELNKKLNSNCRIKTKFTRDLSKTIMVFGQCEYSTSNTNSYALYCGASSYNNGRIHPEYATWANTDKYFSTLEEAIVLDANKNVWSFTDLEGNTIQNITFSTATFESNYNCLVCGGIWSGEWIMKMVGNMYYFQVYEYDDLIYDLVPVKKLDGTVTLYDKISKTYLENLGTEEPVAGPVVSTRTFTSDINVFTQEEEPKTKDGVWLQTDKTHKKVASEKFEESAVWDEQITREKIPYVFVGGSGVRVGDNVYMFGGWGGTTTAYKYNILTNTYTTLPTLPQAIEQSSATAIGDNIYFGGRGQSYQEFYKYNITSNAYTTLASPPNTLYGVSLVAVGDYIYTIGAMYNRNFANKIHRYDTKTNSWSTLSVTTPQYYAWAYSFSIGTDIYLIAMRTWTSSSTVGTSPKDYKFDTVTQTFTEISTPPTDFIASFGCVEGDNVYLFPADSADHQLLGNYRYNISTGVYTKMSDLSTRVWSGVATKQKDEILVFGGGGSAYNGYNILSLHPTPLISKIYNKDTVILFKNENPTDDDIKTKLFSTENLINFDDFVNYPVKDVAYQASDGTNDMTIPTYYGDGTQWVKFKN